MNEGGIRFIGIWNYRDYQLPEGPLKKIVSSDSVKKGDQVIFEIFQKMGEWEEDTDDLYQSLFIKDVLSPDLKYDKAALFDESGEDITDRIGSLSFDRLSNEIRYDFSEEFLADKDNYGGQTYVLRIEGKVDKTSGNIPNQAATFMNGKQYLSNEVLLRVYDENVPVMGDNTATGKYAIISSLSLACIVMLLLIGQRKRIKKH